MLRLQPEELFRPHSLWRLPLLGSHDYRLPETIEERLGDFTEIARDLAASPVEVVVFATDVSEDVHGSGARAYELAYSSRSTPPETMAQAVLASSAVSALVLPRQVGEPHRDRRRLGAQLPARPRVPPARRRADHQLPLRPALCARSAPTWLGRMRRRLERFPKVPPVTGARRGAARGRGAGRARRARALGRHDRATDARHRAAEHGARGAQLRATRTRGLRRSPRSARTSTRSCAARAAGAAHASRMRSRSASSRLKFPFLGDRLIPRIAVEGTAGEISLETGLRRSQPWPDAGEARVDRAGVRAARRGARRAQRRVGGQRQRRTTLPGFMIPFGSSSSLIPRISGMRSPCSSSR